MSAKKIGGGKLEWIPLGELSVHPKAQRVFNQAWGEKLAATFDPEKAQIITVVKTKRGKYLIVDGQHTCYGALRFVGGDKSQCVLCRVFEGDDDASAAQRFLDGNNRLGVRTLDEFLVRVTANDPVALGIVAILSSFDLRVDRSRGKGVVQAVTACESVMGRQRGALLLERVIRILHDAWGDDPDAYSGNLIRGLALVLHKYGPNVDDVVLSSKLAKCSKAATFIGFARGLRSIRGMSMAQAVYERILEEYNKGRRVGRLEAA